VAIALASPHTYADGEVVFGGHAAYAVGAGISGSDTALRHDLDVGALVRFWVANESSGHSLADSTKGAFAGTSAVIGFGRYPTYIAPEIAYGLAADYGASYVIAGGPSFRVDPDRGYGLAVRASAGLFNIEVGAHVVVIPGSEAQLSVTVGVGRL